MLETGFLEQNKVNIMKNNNDIQYLPMFMCFGLSFGTVFGLLTGNQALGMSIGMSIGVCVGILLDAQKKKNTKIKAVVFDFDYTLGDSTEAIVISANYALEKLGYPTKSTEEISKTIGMPIKDIYTALTGVESEEELPAFDQYFVEKIDQIVAEHSELYPDTKNVLYNLKEKGYQTAIVTTKRSYQVKQILEKCEAMELFDMIVGSDNVNAEKPDPKGILHTLKELNLKNEEVLYVGDSMVDARTAENAGVKFAAVLTGTTKTEEFENHECVYIAENLEDIFRYILDLEQEENR